MAAEIKLSSLIDLKNYPVCFVLDLLLADKSTGTRKHRHNIVFATDSYAELGQEFADTAQITKETLLGMNSCVIQPRVTKQISEQSERTRKRAEVFTPSWVCNLMNNYCDQEWFQRADVFNTMAEDGQSWAETKEPIAFPTKRRTWKHYVLSKRLEITCGEAPYLVSRYDTATGELIPIEKRIGILDRKLRVIGENTATEAEWLAWVEKAYQSVYGYEYQGDNLLIARINLLNTFADYLQFRWGRQANKKELKKIANIIAWNIWQMDGLKGTVPQGKQQEEPFHQLSMFEQPGMEEEAPSVQEGEVEAKFHDWRCMCTTTYNAFRAEMIQKDKRRQEKNCFKKK